MRKLALLAVSASTYFNPVLAHFRFVLRVVYAPLCNNLTRSFSLACLPSFFSINGDPLFDVFRFVFNGIIFQVVLYLRLWLGQGGTGHLKSRRVNLELRWKSTKGEGFRKVESDGRYYCRRHSNVLLLSLLLCIRGNY